MNLVDNSDEERRPDAALVAALTTEHYTLQASRSSTVVEANGRSSLFLSATSATTVALALVAQLDQLGDTFMAFTLVVLPALVVLGLTSYTRLADLAVQDAHYARAIGRIRAFYLSLDPVGRQYWMQPAGDDPHAIMQQAGEQHSRWHHFSHTATSVTAVTAVISGALLGLVLSAFSPVPVPGVAVISTVVGSALFGATWLDQERRWCRSARSQATQFQLDGSPAAQAVAVASPTTPAPVTVSAVARPTARTALGQSRASPRPQGRPNPKDVLGSPKEVDDMASSRIIEEESGTYRGRPHHPHNGYYAGDFSGQPLRLLTYKDGQYQTVVRQAP